MDFLKKIDTLHPFYGFPSSLFLLYIRSYKCQSTQPVDLTNYLDLIVLITLKMKNKISHLKNIVIHAIIKYVTIKPHLQPTLF